MVGRAKVDHHAAFTLDEFGDVNQVTYLGWLRVARGIPSR
jgi:hypothetical protein